MRCDLNSLLSELKVQQENKKEPTDQLRYSQDMFDKYPEDVKNIATGNQHGSFVNGSTNDSRKRLRLGVDHHSHMDSSEMDESYVPSFAPSPQSRLNRPTCGKRRCSVSGESFNPADSPLPTPIHKTSTIKKQIEEATRQNLLFKNLDSETREHIYDAMFERNVMAGECIIKQGEPAELFYVVIHGLFCVYVNDTFVTSVGSGGSFGELALMYTNPRTATVKAITNGTLWAVDRATYNRIVTKIAYNRNTVYESFLRGVEIFKSLEPEEITKLADAMEAVQYEDGDTVVRQEEPGELFYVIEVGSVDLVKHDGRREIRLPSLGPGKYFGELALLNDTPRQATVKACGSVRLITLKRDAFHRLLSDTVIENMRRHAESYNNVSTYSGAGGVNVLHTT